MKKVTAIAVPAFVLAGAFLCGCKGSGDASGLQGELSGKSDTQKVDYLMQHAEPDSVARFLCRAAIGKVPGVTIDTLANATLYAYEKYKGDDFTKFSTAFDEYSSNLPLPEKMQLLFKAGAEDPIQLGYELGLSYVQDIRDKHLTVAQIEKEISEFKKVCGPDTETYRRFITGFHIALEADRGKDLSEEVYHRFININ